MGGQGGLPCTRCRRPGDDYGSFSKRPVWCSDHVLSRLHRGVAHPATPRATPATLSMADSPYLTHRHKHMRPYSTRSSARGPPTSPVHSPLFGEYSSGSLFTFARNHTRLRVILGEDLILQVPNMENLHQNVIPQAVDELVTPGDHQQHTTAAANILTASEIDSLLQNWTHDNTGQLVRNQAGGDAALLPDPDRLRRTRALGDVLHTVQQLWYAGSEEIDAVAQILANGSRTGKSSSPLMRHGHSVDECQRLGGFRLGIQPSLTSSSASLPSTRYASL